MGIAEVYGDTRHTRLVKTKSEEVKRMALTKHRRIDRTTLSREPGILQNSFSHTVVRHPTGGRDYSVRGRRSFSKII